MLGSHFIPPETQRGIGRVRLRILLSRRPNEDSSALLGRAGGARVPKRLELGLSHVAREHDERQPREPEPARPRVAGHELMRDQAVIADPELALHPAVLVDLRIQSAGPQCRELARCPFEIKHRLEATVLSAWFLFVPSIAARAGDPARADIIAEIQNAQAPGAERRALN